uniref:FZ domain-containing protein n=1 Tax=Cyclopterus lumpus TaxID=8103 RepID=A0A8C2Z188_CYCLU
SKNIIRKCQSIPLSTFAGLQSLSTVLEYNLEVLEYLNFSDSAHGFGFTQPSGASCQTITVPLCRDLPYTETVLPNVLGHATQEEAGSAAFQFASLVRLGCSAHLKTFVCSVYTPECVSGTPRPPCRTVCEAKRGCEGFMASFDVSWPAELQCDSFPEDKCVSVSHGKETQLDTGKHAGISTLSAKGVKCNFIQTTTQESCFHCQLLDSPSDFISCSFPTDVKCRRTSREADRRGLLCSWKKSVYYSANFNNTISSYE